MLGHHVVTKYVPFPKVTHYAQKTGAQCIQVFLKDPQNRRDTGPSNHVLQKLRQDLEKANIQCLVHASFLLNFCQDPTSAIHQNALNSLWHDMQKAQILGAMGVVVHMGKNTKTMKISEEKAIENYVQGIRSVLLMCQVQEITTPIIFETGAGQGTEVCTSIPCLANLYHQFTLDEQARIGFCIDTCHIFAAGADISTPEGVQAFFAEFDELIGLDNVTCIHLNDSKKELNCRVDRHADIGHGCIAIEGLKSFVQFCHQQNWPMVLETPCDSGCKHVEQMELVRSWYYNNKNNNETIEQQLLAS